jgi:hypothetical protein
VAEYGRAKHAMVAPFSGHHMVEDIMAPDCVGAIHTLNLA